VKVDLIPFEDIQRSIASMEHAGAPALPSSDGAVSSVTSFISHWHGLVREQDLDMPLVPEWSAISAISGETAADFRAIRVSDGNSTVAYSSFLESRVRQYGLPLLMRELPGCRLLCYHPTLVATGSPDVLIDALHSYSGTKCDLIYLPEVVRDSPTDSFIQQLAARRGWLLNRVPSSRAPFLPLSGTWKDYLAGRSSNFRYTLKRKRKALSEHGPVSDQWFSSAEAVPELLRHIESIEEGSWKVAGDMAITRSQQESSYHKLLLPWLARKGALAANVLFVGQEPAAYSLCYKWNGRLAQAKTSFSEKFADCSPGLLVTAAAIERAHDLQLSEFDFLGDAMQHKATWTKSTRDHDHLYLYTSSLTARVVGSLKKLVQRMRRHEKQLTVGRSGMKDTSQH